MTAALTLTPLGHSCVLVDIAGEQGSRTRILLDPGSLAPPLAPIDGLDGILVTHSHHDHIDVDQLRRVTGGRAVRAYGDVETAGVLSGTCPGPMIVVAAGTFQVGGIDVDVHPAPHQPIYPGFTTPSNVGYRIAGRVYAPGDSFAPPPWNVEVLLLPTGAPWMKLSETIDYLRMVSPRFAFPIHDGGLAPAHRELHRSLMTRFAPPATTVLRPEQGEPTSIL